MIRFVAGCTLLVLLSGGGAAVAATTAQDPAAANQALPTTPQAGITRAQAEARITALETEPDLDETRTQLIELYRQLIEHIETAEKHKSLGDFYRQSIDTAPQEAAKVRTALELLEQEPAPPSERPAEKTAEVLQQELKHIKGELTNQRERVAELDRLLAAEEASTTLDQAAQARQTLAKIETDLAAAPAPDPDAAETLRVARTVLLARKLASTDEITMLEQKLLSSEPRSDLRRAEREREAFKLAQAEEKERRLETWLGELRQAEAERARQDAERLRLEAINKHELIQVAAKENADIALETEQYLAKTGAVRERKQVIEGLLERTRAEEEQTQRSIKLGVSRASGTLLLETRRKLPEVRRRATSQRSQQVENARLQLFKGERDIRRLEDPEGVVDALLTEEATLGLLDRDRSDLRDELLTLVAAKVENLERREEALNDYLGASKDLVDQEQALITLAKELGELLDRRLIWIPDATPLSLDTLKQLFSDLRWITGPELWSSAASVIAADFPARLPTYLPVGVVFAALLLMRPRMRRRRAVLREKVGKVREDGIGLTFQALGLHLLDTLAYPKPQTPNPQTPNPFY